MKVSKRALSVPPSATLAVTARAKELIKQGVDVVSFGAGEPDFDTPQYIKDAAVKALQQGKTKYTPARGTPELRQKIAKKLKDENNLDYNPDQVIVTIGGKHSVYEAMQTTLDPGDEVILPAPFWVSYIETIKLAGAVPKIIKTKKENSYKMTTEQLKDAITDKTAMLVINSPNNPGGFAYTPDEMKQIAKILEGTDILVLSDEIYEKFVYRDNEFVSFASLSEDAYNRTLTLNGLSKTFAMTGWRLGYTAGPLDIVQAMGRLQSHMTSNAVTFAQYAAVEALGPKAKNEIDKMKKQFAKRAQLMEKRLNSIKGLSCIEPQGAFYCFPDVSEHFGRNINGDKINSSMDFAKALLEQAKVALVPGKPFGFDENIRLSFASSYEQINKGLDRIEKWLNQ